MHVRKTGYKIVELAISNDTQVCSKFFKNTINNFPNLCNSLTLRCYLQKFAQVKPKFSSIPFPRHIQLPTLRCDQCQDITQVRSKLNSIQFLDQFSFCCSGAITVRISVRCDMNQLNTVF